MKEKKKFKEKELWKKFAILMSVLVAAVVVLCSILIMWFTFHSSQKIALAQVEANLKFRSDNWQNDMIRKNDEKSIKEVQRSMARYCMCLYGDEGSILIHFENSGEPDIIFNRTTCQYQELMRPQYSNSVFTGIIHMNGVPYAAAAIKYYLYGREEYVFYEVMDISSVYQSLYRMAAFLFFMDLLVIGLTGVCSVYLVKRLLKPMEQLRHSARKIAGGVYDQRAVVENPDEIGMLAQDFNRMAEAVEQRVEQLKKETEQRTLLLSALTHELKTPLTGIKGNAQMMRMTRLSEEEQQETLEFIDAECTRMERLSRKLMQLLFLQQNVEGSLELVPCFFQELLEQVEGICGEQLEKRGLKLCVEADSNAGQVEAEPDLLIDLVLNLIDNAAKASASGDTIYLRAKKNTIIVQDFGRGIPDEQLDKITQPFYMVDRSRSKKTGGCGIGLALCMEIARLHHAKLHFESKVGKGTLVEIRFYGEENSENQE